MKAIPIFTAIPNSLRLYHQWALWRRSSQGKCIPVPVFDPPGTPPLSVNTRDRWESLAAVEHTWKHLRRHYDGIGLFIDNVDDLFAIDLDSCLHSSGVRPWARRVIEMCPSYTEISPSGTGLRVIGKFAEYQPTIRNFKKFGALLQLKGFDGMKPADLMVTFRGFSRMTGNIFEDRTELSVCDIGQLLKRLEAAVIKTKPICPDTSIARTSATMSSTNATRRILSIGEIFQKVQKWDFEPPTNDGSSLLFALCKSLVKYYSYLNDSQIKKIILKFHSQVQPIPMVSENESAIDTRIAQARSQACQITSKATTFGEL